MIQCAARMKLSRKAMRTRRQRRREELAEKEKDREVERQLNELHAQLEKDLLVMRIQCSARCMIARNRFRKQRVLFEKKLKEKKEARRTRAATCIQAYFRACVVRSWYRRNVEELRRKQQAMRRLTYVPGFVSVGDAYSLLFSGICERKPWRNSRISRHKCST